MADLKDIASIKSKLLSLYANDKDIFECLKNNNDSIVKPKDLLCTQIVPYFYNLGVEKTQKAYILMRIYAPRLNDNLIENFVMDIGIACHKSLMEYKGITRIDYLLPKIDNLTSTYNKKAQIKHPLNNLYKIGIDNIILRAVSPFSLYDADYDGYILTYSVDLMDSRCNN